MYDPGRPGRARSRAARDRAPARRADPRAGASRHVTAPARCCWWPGPGTGKTRTLTHRVAYLLASGRAQPREILAVTFSVRAAGELRLRLADLLGETVARAA